MLKKIFRYCVDILYPPLCPFCDGVIPAGRSFCQKCESEFPEQGIVTKASESILCVSPFAYIDKYSEAVKRFKFSGRRQYANALAHTISTEVKREYAPLRIDGVCFVPMMDKRVKKRGYNQSELLAKELAKLMGVPFVKALVKIKENEEQHKLPASMRIKNVKGVYDVINGAELKGKALLLVDDIITTGSTLSECARLLVKRGAYSVHCATVTVVQKPPQ